MDLDWPEFTHNFVGFTSPYLRALKTTAPMARRWNIKFIVDHRVGEVPTEQYRKFYGNMKSRIIDFPACDWSRFPLEGIDIHKRTMDDYWVDLASFVQELPERAIIISHMTTIQDLTALLTNKKQHELRDRVVPNIGVTLIEEGKLVFMGQR